MTIDKLPSGSYRIRQMDHGKVYTLIVKKLPSDRIAQQLIDEKIALDSHSSLMMSFKTAAQKYVAVKSNVLSPSTIRGYNSMIRNIPEDFLNLDIGEIKTYDVQKLVNDYIAKHSAKSTYNLHGFVVAVLGLFLPDLHIHTTLPQKPRTEPYTPSVDDVKALLSEAHDTEYYVPLYLATLSCRCSEICALTLDDLDGDQLTINKALVRADKGYILKPAPKTDASNRSITIPHELAERIREQGYVYKNYPQQIDKYLRRTLPKLGIPFFSLHKLRHFFASYSHELGYSDATIQSIGGWATDSVMKRVYRHALNADEARQQVSSDFKF